MSRQGTYSLVTRATLQAAFEDLDGLQVQRRLFGGRGTKEDQTRNPEGGGDMATTGIIGTTAAA